MHFPMNVLIHKYHSASEYIYFNGSSVRNQDSAAAAFSAKKNILQKMRFLALLALQPYFSTVPADRIKKR
jgi:hypothetical protein